MASRSVNSLQFCKDDMRRAYREKAQNKRRRRLKIRDVIDILDIIVPVIPHFFGNSGVHASGNCSAGPDNYNMGGSYGREDDRPFRCGNGGGHYGLGMGSDDYGNESGQYYGGHGNANHNGNHGMRMGMARPDDYYDREITEEEFERLIDFAEECNIKKY